jgi:hyaluronan synthase
MISIMNPALLLAPPLVLWGAWAAVLTAQARSAARYRPATRTWTADVTVVTTVYDADPALFAKAVASWISNGVIQVVAVIDGKNRACVDTFRTLGRERTACALTLVVTEKPGKRPAIVDGCAVATAPIIVFADADTVWSTTFLQEVLKPFADPSVGASSGYDDVVDLHTPAQYAYATAQDFSCGLLLKDTVARGRMLTCMSGRSSAYRREVILPAVGGLLTETFRGKRFKSGDDVYLGNAVLAAGFKTAYQASARCSTVAAPTIGMYWHQIVRWNRNTFRGRIMGYGAEANPPLPAAIAARDGLRLLVHLSTPAFWVVYAAFGRPGTAFALAAVAYTVSVFALRLSGNGMATALRRAPAFAFAQSMTCYGSLLAYCTIEEDGWLTHVGEDRQPKSLTGRATYAGLLAMMAAAIVAYATVVV